MLDGEVRLGKDWADQVTRISSWVKLLSRPHSACTSMRVCSRMRGSFCLLERTCVLASVCLQIFLNQYTLLSFQTTSYIHTLYQQRAQTLLKNAVHTNDLSISLYIFHNIQIHLYFPFTVCIYFYIFK